MMNKIEGFFDRTLIWALRILGILFLVFGSTCVIAVGYVTLALIPEMVVVVGVFGTGFLGTAAWLFKAAKKLSA